MSNLKLYNISIRVVGYEYYNVEAENEDEAIQSIKDGDGYLQASEVGWSGDFCVDSVEDI